MEKENVIEKKNKMSLFKKLDLWRNIIFILFYALFLGFNIYKGKGNMLINRILIGVTIGYLVFFIIVSTCEIKDKNNKEIKKSGKKAYKIIKKSMLLISALMTVGTIISVHGETNFTKLYGTIFTVVNLSIQILLTIMIDAISKKIHRSMDAIKEKYGDNISDMKNKVTEGVKGLKDRFSKKPDDDQLSITEESEED